MGTSSAAGSDERVAIVVLNWNGRQDTLDCLASLSRVDYPNLRTIVVDNGSVDGSPESVREHYPGVTVIETGRNLGYAGGNNVGIREALNWNADFVLLLNNDAVVSSDIVTQLIGAASLRRDAGIFAAKVYYLSEPDKVWFAGARWRPDAACFMYPRLDEADTDAGSGAVLDTDYASGCALLARAAVFRTVGLLDERFFLYYEETDLCFRARRAGHPSVLVPSAKVWHKVSSSFGGPAWSPMQEYFLTRNRLLWAERNLPWSQRLKLYRAVGLRLANTFLFGKPDFRPSVSGRARYFGYVREYVEAFRSRRYNAMGQARWWGVRDYISRRFGDCPSALRCTPETFRSAI